MVPPDFSFSPLFAAVRVGSVEIVKLLLASDKVRVDVNLQNYLDENAFDVCVKQCLCEPSVDLLIIAALLLRSRSTRKPLSYYFPDGALLPGGDEASSSSSSDGKAQSVEAGDQLDSVLYPKPVDKNLFKLTADEVKADLCALIQYEPVHCKIYDLARENDFRGVKALLMQGADVNACCPNKRFTALIAAVYNKSYQIVELLLQSADIFDLTDCNYFNLWFTETHIADEALLDAPEKHSPQRRRNNELILDIRGKGSMTALHYAAQLGDTKMVGRLLQAGKRERERESDSCTTSVTSSNS
jgi:ankyrin repeat protein